MPKINIKTEKVNKCPICKATNFSYILTAASPEYITNVSLTSFPIVRCQSCSFVFLSERPILKHLIYYYPQTCPNFKSSTTTKLDHLLVKVLKLLSKSSGDPDSGSRQLKVLDLGFGAGDFLNDCFTKGYDCYGVDFSKHAYSEAKKKNPKLRLHCGTVFDAGFEDNFFDWINLSHVLEHTYDPLALMQYIRRLLKKGGYVTMDVPNYGGLYYSVAKKSAEYFVPQHVSFFSQASMRVLLNRSCYRNFEVRAKIGNNLSFHILKALGIQKSFYQKSILNQLLGIPIVLVESLLSKGDVIFVKAYK